MVVILITIYRTRTLTIQEAYKQYQDALDYFMMVSGSRRASALLTTGHEM